MRIGVVGCGVIAHRYAADIAREERLRLVAATDALPDRADAFVAEHGGRSHASLEPRPTDEEVDLVVNPTRPEAHAPETAAALRAGEPPSTEPVPPLSVTTEPSPSAARS